MSNLAPYAPAPPNSSIGNDISIAIGPNVVVQIVPMRHGDDLYLNLRAQTPQGMFEAQAHTTVEAWRNILAYGKAKFGPRLRRWFDYLMAHHGMGQGSLPLNMEVQDNGDDEINEITEHSMNGGSVGAWYQYAYYPVVWNPWNAMQWGAYRVAPWFYPSCGW